jgi:hypothetical protein
VARPGRIQTGKRVRGRESRGCAPGYRSGAVLGGPDAAEHPGARRRGWTEKFLGQLFNQYLPLLPPRDNEPVSVDGETGLAHGALWSRGLGQALAILFCHDSVLEESLRPDSSGVLLGKYRVGSLLRNPTAQGLTGAVFELQDSGREMFDARAQAGQPPR